MKFLLLIWKKLVVLVIILVSIIMLLNQKSYVQEVIEEHREQMTACHREVESLNTQLTVLKTYRQKVHEDFQKQQHQAENDLQELKSQIQALKAKNSKLKITIEQCNNQQPNDVVSNVIVKPVINEDEKGNNLNENNRDSDSTGKMAEKLKEQEKEIMELKTVIDEMKKNETDLIQHTIEQGRSETNNEVDPLHPAEEHKGYADGDNVHFHRQLPHSADLEFKRGDENKVNLPQILNPKDFVKKMEERKQRKMKNPNYDGVKADGREEVVDYQSFKKPDKEEDDYKEMGA